MITPRPGVRRRPRLSITLGIAALLGAALAAPTAAVAPPAPTTTSAEAPQAPAGGPTLRLIKGGFNQPLFLTHAGDARLFVVERTGRIRILKKVGGEWTISGTFLDLRGKVDTGNSEQGLLGLAFHPDYATNGRFYVNYTRPGGDTVIAEYRRETRGRADPGSRRVLMTISQPFDNHNGGWMGFKDDLLYIATGDGGDAFDPFDNGQDLGTRLGKILRIDPLDPDGNGPRRFAIPADNPFVDKDGLDVIWAYGLRNPWRDSFDAETGQFWITDVGQDEWEEVNRTATGKGKNFGWKRLEGKHLVSNGNVCTSNCKTLPILEYRNRNGNCAIVGGYVSRRPGAALEGRYLYADTCSGRIWNIPATYRGGPIPSPLDTSLFITSFGEGNDRTLYVLGYSPGRVYRVNGS